MNESLPSLIAALLEPEAYPEPRPDRVELRETHISYVLLAGDRVYKIKKPRNLGFLDFTTAARRAYYCRREVALNRRLAPHVYLGVVPIVERGGAIRVGGRGRVRERAVLMRRLPERGMLTHLLAESRATPTHVARVAARLAAFHATADHGPSVARYGSPRAVRRNVLGNLERAAPYVGQTLSAEQYAYLHDWTTAFFAEHGPLLRQRVRAGRIRDGHGDAHAASICFLDADPAAPPAPAPAAPSLPPLPPADVAARDEGVVLFDCIEFAPRLRCTDVAAEVAFLAMDLDRNGRADLAALFLTSYEAASGDEALRQLLPFYQCYRACVRGLVASIASAEPHRDAEDRAAQATLARGYFDLAQHAYAGGAPRPLLLLLGGLPASGKSTLARALAGRLALVPLNSDVLRKRLAGLAPTARAAAGVGEGLYTSAANVATYAALVDEARAWLARGVSVALDASFRSRADRAAVVALADELGVPWLAVECRATPDATRARLAARADDASAVSDADWAVHQQLVTEWEPWHELPAARHLPLDTGGDVDTAVAAVLVATRALAPRES